MKAGQLALGFLTLSMCMWVAHAATGTSTTTTEAATTTTTTAGTTTTTTTTAASTSSVRRRKVRVSNLRFSVTRRYRIYRNTTASTRSRSRRLAVVRNRRLVRVLRRSNNLG
ncbi:hypothetical protein KR038_010087 [Drosophila bunnanda]|nr:hypothetical protein KR038_010087 [Drosophila bunnanda]